MILAGIEDVDPMKTRHNERVTPRSRSNVEERNDIRIGVEDLIQRVVSHDPAERQSASAGLAGWRSHFAGALDQEPTTSGS